MPTYIYFENDTGRDGSTDEKAGQSLTREFEVTTDTPAVDAGDIIAALATLAGVSKGAVHPTYAYARCTRISASPVKEYPGRWIVRADYQEPAPQPGSAINPGGGGSGGGQPSPPDRDPWVRGTFRRVEEHRTHDLGWPNPGDKKLIANSFGDPFENPPPFYSGVGVMTVTRYYDAISYSALMAYLNKTNDATWNGFAKDMLLITGVDWEPVTERGWVGWKVVYTVEHKDLPPADMRAAGQTGGWNPTPVLDQGWMYREAGNELPFRDSTGHSPKMGLLNGLDGSKAVGGVPTYRFFRQYDRISFAALG